MALSEIRTNEDLPINRTLNPTELTEGMIRAFSTTSLSINIQFVRKKIPPNNTGRVGTFKSAPK